eukprot:jgi/Bigna1/75625/fgenesh1_pg.36_\
MTVRMSYHRLQLFLLYSAERFTAEILVEKNSANDSATTMEARATLYRYNNASLSEGMITYKYAGGSITIPSTSFSNFNTNGMHSTVEMRINRDYRRYIIRICSTTANFMFEVGQKYTGLPQAHIASPGLQNETSVIYLSFQPGTPERTHSSLPTRVLDVCRLQAIMGKDISMIDTSHRERLQLAAGFPLDAYLLPDLARVE